MIFGCQGERVCVETRLSTCYRFEHENKVGASARINGFELRLKLAANGF